MKQYIEKEKTIAYVAEQYRLFKGENGEIGVATNEKEKSAIAQIDAIIDILENMPTVEIEDPQ